MQKHTKKVIIILLLFFSKNLVAQVGIGTTTPHKSAILDVTSNNKGFLPPRLSTIERNSIANPTNGLMIFNTNYKCLQYYNGNNWIDLCCAKKVQKNLVDLSYLYRLDPTDLSTFRSMSLDVNNNGTNTGLQPSIGDYLFEVDLKNSNNTVTTTASYVVGSIEPTLNSTGDGIFTLDEKLSDIPYKNQKFMTRNNTYSGSAGGGTLKASSLTADIPDLDETLDIYIVGKFDGNPPGSSACFFSTSIGPNKIGSFQLGSGAGVAGVDECNSNTYTLRLRDSSGNYLFCGSTLDSPDATDKRVSVLTDDLHVFNIRSYPNGTEYAIQFYIDGVLVSEKDDLTDSPKIELIRLFINRSSNSGTISSIGELIISDTLLPSTQQNALNEFLLCKY
jgi:hypothetical protein